MNVEERIKSTDEIPLNRRTIIHLMLVANTINEHLGHALKPFDISIQQFNVLRILRGQKGKPANLSTLNERMVTKMSNTTRLVDKLIMKKFVERHTCPSNRRKIEIRITTKGNEQLSKMDVLIAETETDLLKQFTTNELEHLNLLLNKF
ncbi:MAG: MarR family transcriptional regulator [Maribacter sp.]|uniref:MarR family winged helix-turn-helix transcriptional regulator n=1 Tax=Maribacter sp. TaxID=1897614 RepID=UPI003C72EB3D